MILYNGIDIVEIARIGVAIKRSKDRFLKRVYTDAELDVCGGVPSLAAHFAAKEAVMKCLGMGMFEVDWKDIEILYARGGRPELNLRGHALRRAKKLRMGNFCLSLSHSRDYAVASVVSTGMS